MNRKTKWIAGFGAMLVAGSTFGAVAFADTTTPATGATSVSSASQSGLAPVKGQIQQLRGALKALEAQRKADNAIIRADFQSFKGKHVWKNNQSALNAVKATHAQIVAARNALQADIQKDKADRQAKNWSQLVTGLEQTERDLATLVGLKDQQVKNLQGVNLNQAPSGTASDGTDAANTVTTSNT